MSRVRRTPFLDERRRSPRISEALRRFAPQSWAALLVAGCAGAAPVPPDLEPLRAELRELRKENEALSARVEALSNRVDLLTVRAAAAEARSAGVPAAGPGAPGKAAAPSSAVVPPDLAVVKLSPEPQAAGRLPARSGGHAQRVAPPLPTAVPIKDPDPASLDALSRASHRSLSADAELELRQARALTGLARAHALEDFAARYPQHASADNALVEASAAYAAAGREDAACTLARRVVDEYPAGDVLGEALERLATCEDRGKAPAEQRSPSSPEASWAGATPERAGSRPNHDSGRSGDGGPPDIPARSSP